MFIQTEMTPNPATLKFLPDCIVMSAGVAEFKRGDDVAQSPLAAALFMIDGIDGVYLGHDFIALTKHDSKEWLMLKPSVLGAIMDHFTSNRPVMLGAAAEVHAEDDANPIVAHIKDLLDTRIRPAVAQDGGDITFLRFEDGVVYLSMRGACSGCPSSTATLKNGIESMLRHYIPEVQEVRAG